MQRAALPFHILQHTINLYKISIAPIFFLYQYTKPRAKKNPPEGGGGTESAGGE